MNFSFYLFRVHTKNMKRAHNILGNLMLNLKTPSKCQARGLLDLAFPLFDARCVWGGG